MPFENVFSVQINDFQNILETGCKSIPLAAQTSFARRLKCVTLSTNRLTFISPCLAAFAAPAATESEVNTSFVSPPAPVSLCLAGMSALPSDKGCVLRGISRSFANILVLVREHHLRVNSKG